MCYSEDVRAILPVVLTIACGSGGAPTPPLHGEPVPPAPTARRCPPPPAERLAPDDAPPWERDPLGESPGCLETGDGATVTLEPDPGDPDGWRATLVIADASHVRARAATRGAASFQVAPDGGVAIAHVEDDVSRFGPTGTLLWKTHHPYCGHAALSIGRDGRIVLGCGYSLVAFTADGHFAWQKWPFGNVSVGRPLLASDGTMIVRSHSVVAELAADGTPRWTLDTGTNRYVHPIGVTRDGNLVFVTSMAEMHTPGPVHVYYPTEPDELFVVGRDGHVISRAPLAGAPHWPATVPWSPELRAGQLPW